MIGWWAENHAFMHIELGVKVPYLKYFQTWISSFLFLVSAFPCVMHQWWAIKVRSANQTSDCRTWDLQTDRSQI